MAGLTVAKTKSQLSNLTQAKIRDEYLKLAEDYNKITTGRTSICPKCGRPLTRSNFYNSDNYVVGHYPICKSCVFKIVEQNDDNDADSNETKESVQRMCSMMDVPYMDDLYNKYLAVNEKHPFRKYITAIQSLPQYSGKTYKDSKFGLEGEAKKYDQAMVEKGRKHFGNYSDEDLVFLQEQYDEWLQMYGANTKSQWTLFQQICFIQLDLDKARKTGADTKDLLKQLQELMSSLNIKPNQSSSDNVTNKKTFGQMIEEWEDEYKGGRPIPEPDSEFKDINKIDELRQIYAGTLAYAADLKNGYSEKYEEFMKKYTVEPPHMDDDIQSQEIREKLFGKALEEE